VSQFFASDHSIAQIASQSREFQALRGDIFCYCCAHDVGAQRFVSQFFASDHSVAQIASQSREASTSSRRSQSVVVFPEHFESHSSAIARHHSDYASVRRSTSQTLHRHLKPAYYLQNRLITYKTGILPTKPANYILSLFSFLFFPAKI
jgi:hypothetical protein